MKKPKESASSLSDVLGQLMETGGDTKAIAAAFAYIATQQAGWSLSIPDGMLDEVTMLLVGVAAVAWIVRNRFQKLRARIAELEDQARHSDARLNRLEFAAEKWIPRMTADHAVDIE